MYDSEFGKNVKFKLMESQGTLTRPKEEQEYSQELNTLNVKDILFPRIDLSGTSIWTGWMTAEFPSKLS